MTTNLTVASNVPDVKKFLFDLNSTTLNFNRDFKEKETFINEISGNLLDVDTKIEVVNEETKIEFMRIMRTKENAVIKTTQKYISSSLSPDIVSVEVEFPLHLNIGVGYIKYRNGDSYYGLMKAGEPKPFLMGVFTDSNGQETVKLDQGIEYGLTAFVTSAKNLTEVIQFMKEHVDKGYLSDLDYKLFIDLTFKSDLIKSDNKISQFNAEYLKQLALKTTINNVLLDSYIISLANYSNNPEEVLFNLENKDGNMMSFKELSLEQLKDLATTVATHYSKTNEFIYDFEIVAKELKAKYYPSACEALFKKLNLPQTSKLYVNNLEKLATTDFYIRTDDSLELKKIDLHFEFSILSNSGRTGYTFKNKTGFVETYDQAQRWVGYSLHIDLGNNSSVFTVSEPNIYSDVYDAAKKIFG